MEERKGGGEGREGEKEIHYLDHACLIHSVTLPSHDVPPFCRVGVGMACARHIWPAGLQFDIPDLERSAFLS